MRPRIRTVKPEMRQDERYARLSYPARELFNGLITLADDEGRFRALSSAVLGHVFPYDDDAPRKLRDWVAEIKDSGMVLFYVDGGVPYGAFRHWRRHQRINRPNPSDLPPPPDHTVVRDNSVSDHGNGTNGSRPNHGNVTDDASPHAQACGPLRSDPSTTDLLGEGPEGDARAVDLPADFPPELTAHLDGTFAVLVDLAARHNARSVTRLSLASVVMARRFKPLVRAAHDYAAWSDAKAQRRRDVVAGYRNWLDRTDDLAAIEPLGTLPAVGGNVVPMRAAALERADGWLAGYGEGAS